MRGSPRSFVVVAFALAAAGCGSTVQMSARASSGQAAGQGLTVPANGATSFGPLPGAPAGPDAAAGSGTTGGAAAGAQAGPPGAAPRARLPTTVASRGVTPTTVLVGATYPANAAAEDAALGAGSQSPGDTQADARAAAADINAHGGIAGHKVEIAFFKIDAASSESADQQYQDACSYWTQDRHVFAILADSNPTLEACAAKAGVPMLSGGFSSADVQTYRSYPLFIEISSLDLDRVGTATVDGLYAQHYFAGWNLGTRSVTAAPPRIGVIAWDTPTYRRAVQDYYLPALARHGLPKPETAFVAPPPTVSDVASTSAATKSVALKWASDGVDHVLIADGAAGPFSGGGLTLEFVNNASSQNYYPRYGMNSTNGLSQLAPDLAPGSLNGSLGVGWMPLFDEPEGPDPDAKASVGRRHCVAVMAAAGIRAQNRNAEAVEMEECDEFYFLRAAVEAAGGRLTAGGFLSGANGLGNRFDSGLTDVTYFSATHHSGAAATRPALYRSDCTCYVYDGPPQRVR